jgi:hypothetical protein
LRWRPLSEQLTSEWFARSQHPRREQAVFFEEHYSEKESNPLESPHQKVKKEEEEGEELIVSSRTSTPFVVVVRLLASLPYLLPPFTLVLPTEPGHGQFGCGSLWRAVCRCCLLQGLVCPCKGEMDDCSSSSLHLV